jgi:hypothetical protein
MSIKKLFGSTDKSNNYLSDTNQKDAFQDAESARNVRAIKEKQETFVPQIDWSETKNFAKYGSAYLYYKGAVERIHDYYPYDGSDAEINEFYNNLLGVEKYIFDNEYPRTNGYAIISADGWGTTTINSGSGYGLPSELEYITFYGGPNSSSYTTLDGAFSNPHDSRFQYSNIYDTSIYQTEGLPTDYGDGTRESNLKSDFDTGVTVEFWLKKDGFNNALTSKEVVFDMWNNNDPRAVDYGRLTIELTGATTPASSLSPFLITAQSGTTGIFTASIGQNLTADSLKSWQHYAISFYNSGSNFVSKLYVSGTLNDTYIENSLTLGELPEKDLMGRIGSLLTNVGPASGTITKPALADAVLFNAATGSGKLSGSLDEFRFWKEARSANDIARNYIGQVRGGVNSDISNTTLGIYFKFNEGITGTSSVDDTVLDYSGRIGNGVWTGYDTYSRNTNSAIVESSASATEYKDPIIYSFHSDVTTLKGNLLDSGSYHDSNNNGSFLSLMPGWVVEEQDDETSDLKKLTHIVGVYLDKLHLQISALPALKTITYTSSSHKPLPFAQHLPQSLGLYMPELFIDSDVMEKFLSRDQTSLFESDLDETKNLIYLNLYNNLAGIYKSKGTEKSIKNVFRCFNLDDRLIKLSTYSSGRTFPLKNNLEQTLVNKTHINLNKNENKAAVVYQAKGTSETSATAVDAIDTTGVKATLLDVTFTFSVPPAKGGEGGTTTISLQKSATTSPTAGASSIGIGFSNKTDAEIAELIINAINGASKTNIVFATSANGQSGYQSGIRASQGSSNTQITLTMISPGSDGNLTNAIAEGVHSGESVVVVTDFTGGTGESSGHISGSASRLPNGTDEGEALEDKYGLTVEADITFPYFNIDNDPVHRNFYTASLFGVHTVFTGATSPVTTYPFNSLSASRDGTDTTLLTGSQDYANFQVFACRDELGSKNVHFRLDSLNAPNPLPALTSSTFFNVYDNDRWNFSVRIKPSNYPVAEIVTGSTGYTYDVIFRGVNAVLGNVQDSFIATGSVTKAVGQNFLRAPKRLYAGARNTNLTGANLQECDATIGGVKYWTKYLEDEDLNQHIFDTDNMGISGSYKNISALDSNNSTYDYLNLNTIVLDWNFDSVTGSDSGGNFDVKDISSGSALIRDNYGWLGLLAGYQHTGYGSGFEASSTDVIDKHAVNTFKFVNPENPASSDMINILSSDDVIYGLPVSQTIPSFFHTIEKSIYNAISEEMLTFFAGAIDFNNIIGEPVNRYRSRYKAIEKLREIFFRRVTSVTDVEKYVTYYKWFDDALSQIVSQLLPASSEFNADTLNIIESHVLERDKYKSQFPLIEYKTSTEGPATGINELTYNWRLGHHPVSDVENKNTEWWSSRADRQVNSKISSGDTDVEIGREIIRRSVVNNNNQTASALFTVGGARYTGSTYRLRRLTLPYKLDADRQQTYKGGVNFTDNKNIHFAQNALYPDGPIETPGTAVIPENILVFFASDIIAVKDSADFTSPPELMKTKRNFKVQPGRDWQGGIGYTTVKSSYVLPFNIISASRDNPTTGYNKNIVDKLSGGLQVTNLHNDVYGPDMEVPMQGPFTSFAVGGHQSRHVAVNTGSDDYTNRPEAWKMLLGVISGSSPDITGALGMVGADYPWPNTQDPVGQRAVYYRSFVAKRPVNLRNIASTTSSVLGNYDKNWQVVSTVGAFENPKHFVDNQPTLPDQIIQTPGASQARSILDIHRGDDSHFQFIPDYSAAYLTGANKNSVIIGRFAAPGGIEVMGNGYQDIGAAELSVYNALPYRNLTVIKPSQGPSGSTSEATGSGTTGIRVSDIHGKDFGLRAHLARHAGRFGRDSLLVTNPGASYDESPAFHKTQRNTKIRLKITNNGDIFNAPTITVATSSRYDNFFVQHQIPCSDRQYAWVTSSLASDSTDIRFHGMAPLQGPQAGLYSSSADGYVSFLNYVSASDVLGTTTPSLYQPTERLGIFIVDPVDNISASPNTLGNTLTSSNTDYINSDLLTKAGINAEITSSVNYFNLLMTQRGNSFGWSWTGARSSDHPILLKQRRANTLTVYENNAIKSYRMAPVSTRGRPAYINYDIEGSAAENITIQSTFNNERIRFNETDLDDLQYPTSQWNATPFEQLIELGKDNDSYHMNWVQYGENIFPSLRNEYLSRSTERVGYDNKFWRNSLAARIDVGTSSANSFGLVASQSCWLLDAQEDFLTRTASVAIDTAGGAFVELLSKGKAGELQNNYVLVHTGAGANLVTSIKSLAPAALYSRKHLLSSPLSVVSPAGINIAETGSLSKIYLDNVEIYAGEAVWEAPSQAGIVVKSGSTFNYEVSASAPWFDEYNDFKEELKLLAKDYAIIPEFRISEHVEDYVKYGLFNRNKLDTFEIPGTTANSSTASFYKDYSNSEFMTNFVKVRNDTALGAKEIRLVCSAAIRFNPYKGFYPAQRTSDLVKQLSSSYARGFVTDRQGTVTQVRNGAMRPLAQALFAPGILYNSIKSGIAVDYPIVTEPTKISKNYYGGSSGTDNWMITSRNTGSSVSGEGYTGGMYWDLRVPFEAIIEPEKYLNNIDFFDVEPHPSASLNATASWTGQSVDSIYSLMASNFFGEVGKFFLKDSGFTKMKSDIITSDLEFSSGSIYGARLKIRRSTTGTRTYQFESGSSGDNTAYTKFGGKLHDGSNFGTSGYPIPQDPRQNPGFKESFTMYSRPTAFGPPIAGRPGEVQATNHKVTASVPMDGLSGFNWAYTPPYYHGESWVDFIFEPTTGSTYNLEKILAETKTVFWRADPGISASYGQLPATQLIATFSGSSALPGVGDLIYEGKNINANAMQLTASVNCFGIERVARQSTDKFGNDVLAENETVGMKWVIQPKFETPMLNFNDEGVHPISNANSTLSIPTYGSASVPRGMWHQFGVIPETSDKGVFLEMGEIPVTWLKNHYDVIVNNSTYNSNGDISGLTVYERMKPLTDVVKFSPSNSKVRLGELADKKTIKEAVVVVPYVLESVVNTDANNVSGEFASERKKFITIPEEQFTAALSESIGSLKGDSLAASGESIRKLVQKMEKYVLPPQFDFLNNRDVAPVVMYMLEFEYALDKDDLSYIWQNLAPREYQKMTFTSESVAHELLDTELLNEDDLMNENLRWMVFKVKQRSQTMYSDLMTAQAGQSANGELFGSSENNNIGFNWPYDYLSFVELIKIDAEVLYHNPGDESSTTGSSGGGMY